VTTGNWHHFFIAFKGEAGNGVNNQLVIYQNRQLVNTVGSHTTDNSTAFTTGMNGLPFFVGSDGNGETVTVGMADFWFDVGNNFIETDGTVSSATLDKFVTPGLLPVDVGASGELPTGSAPTVFMHRDYNEPDPNAFAVNRGVGGTFVLDGPLNMSATNPDGTTNTIGGDSVTETVSIDFKNGIYTIGGVSKTLDEVLVHDASYGNYDSSAVVADVGLTVTNTFTNSTGTTGWSPVLSAAAQAAVLANGNDAGFTAVVKFNTTETNGLATVGLELTKSDDTIGWGLSAGWSKFGPSASLYDESSFYHDPEIPSPGAHTVAVTLCANRLSSSFDGLDVIGGYSPQANTPTPVVGMWVSAGGIGAAATGTGTATIESITFYNTTMDDNLRSLSGS
jgi:hypothetical protein